MRQAHRRPRTPPAMSPAAARATSTNQAGPSACGRPGTKYNLHACRVEKRVRNRRSNDARRTRQPNGSHSEVHVWKRIPRVNQVAGVPETSGHRDDSAPQETLTCALAPWQKYDHTDRQGRDRKHKGVLDTDGQSGGQSDRPEPPNATSAAPRNLHVGEERQRGQDQRSADNVVVGGAWFVGNHLGRSQE